MEDLLEFLFGASGRINRAKYWRSVLISIGAGLMTAVILFTAAGIAGTIWSPKAVATKNQAAVGPPPLPGTA